jgi:hypothetical protein
MSTPIPSAPEATQDAAPFAPYLRLVPSGNILVHMERQLEETVALLRDLSEAEAETRHAPYTWSIKEVVGHLIDAERIFGYRALRFARRDRTELPGFEENDYVRNARFDARSLGSLVEEFELVRRSHLLFFRGLDEEAWDQSGVANGYPIKVRTLAAVIVGHTSHHGAILRKRLSR